MAQWPDGKAVPFGDRGAAIARQRAAIDEIGQKMLDNMNADLTRFASGKVENIAGLLQGLKANITGTVLNAWYKYDCLSNMGWRSGMIRGYILGKGLGKHSEEILTGIYHSTHSDDDSRFQTMNDALTYYRTAADASLSHHLEYIDRWQMYKHMFEKIERVGSPVATEQAASLASERQKPL